MTIHVPFWRSKVNQAVIGFVLVVLLRAISSAADERAVMVVDLDRAIQISGVAEAYEKSRAAASESVVSRFRELRDKGNSLRAKLKAESDELSMVKSDVAQTATRAGKTTKDLTLQVEAATAALVSHEAEMAKFIAENVSAESSDGLFASELNYFARQSLEEFAQKKGLMLVIEKSNSTAQVLFAAKEVDITEELAKYMAKKGFTRRVVGNANGSE